MTHFDNYEERQIFQAINLLKDENLVWSKDMEVIRHHLAHLMERIMQIEWRFLEPEIGDLALNLIKDNERENNARRNDTTGKDNDLQGKDNLGNLGCKGSSNSCQCDCK